MNLLILPKPLFLLHSGLPFHPSRTSCTSSSVCLARIYTFILKSHLLQTTHIYFPSAQHIWYLSWSLYHTPNIYCSHLKPPPSLSLINVLINTNHKLLKCISMYFWYLCFECWYTTSFYRHSGYLPMLLVPHPILWRLYIGWPVPTEVNLSTDNNIIAAI